MGFANKRKYIVASVVWALAGMISLAPLGDAYAQGHHHKHHGKKHARHAHAIYTRPSPASFIIDADTGRVIESENADAPRYPASLTKMMTLYLTFEALDKGKLNLNSLLPISEHAAGQPQTNIALAPGDTLAVKEAILSIVVRSANDAAVALGETLGGSESGFAEKMTRKARQLGMKHTVFHNASGLPDPQQHTTARDMATLGLALRKDFPEYFPYFRTESFSYRGVTYTTHNHVMMRYDGVDGIKTGYIRASGFNLVTSATRDNHHLIAVVLGGSSVRSRDDRMIALLDQTFTQLARLPGSDRVQLASMVRRKAVFDHAAENNEAAEGEGDLSGDSSKTGHATANAPAPSQDAFAAVSEEEWGIQVGAFAGTKEAKAAAARAMKLAKSELDGSSLMISDEKMSHATHRARLIHLTQDQAESACHKITAAHAPCFAYKLD